MKPLEEQLNDLIVDAYRSILKVEETILKRSDNIDLSINEMHMLEAVGKGKNKPKTISEIAEDLGITLPSVTVAINKLVKKGYVEKLRGEEDARIVYVTLTKQGKKIDSVHRYFHESMVRSIISGMSEQEQQVLYQGILKLDLFLKKKINE
jgi:DNA-binding MarR family transcriptional regulator